MAKKMDMAKLAERLNQLNQQSNRSNSGMSFLDIKDGRNVVRILPPHSSSEMFYEEAWVHYGVGKSEENKKGSMVVCPTTLGDHMKCPVCELSKQFRALSKKKDDSYDKQAREIMRKKRVYYNAIDRGEDISTYTKDGDTWKNEDGEEGSPVKVMSSGVGVFKDLLGYICDPEYGDITDAEEGLDVIITKSGSGFNTKYEVKTARKESAIGFDEWEPCLHDLKPLVKPKTYDEICAIMTGEPVESSEDDDKEDDNQAESDTGSSADTDTGTETGGDNPGLQDEIKAALDRRRRNK